MKRQILYGANTAIAIIVFAAILILINMIPPELKAVGLFGKTIPLQKEWDLTRNKRFTLSDISLKVLGHLKAPVTAIGFSKRNAIGYDTLHDMLKEYAFNSPNFTYRVVDPERDPLTAEKYKIKMLRTVVLKSGGHVETISLPPGGKNDLESMESKITAGLLHLLNPTTATVYFTTGHGEAALDAPGDGGLAAFKSALEGENYVVKPLSLMDPSTTGVPPDASVVVIAGVEKDFLPSEIQMLEKYLEHGGRLLIFCDSMTSHLAPLPNLEKFLAVHGIVAQRDVVFSSMVGPVQGPQRILFPAVTSYGMSPITQDFRLPTIFYLPRSFVISNPPKGSNVQPLATTIPDSIEVYHKLDMRSLQLAAATSKISLMYNAKTDKRGPAVLAVTGTYSATPLDVSLPSEASPNVKLPIALASGVPMPKGSPAASASGAPAASASGAPAASASGAPAASASGAPAASASGAPAASASGAPAASASGAPAASASGAPAAKPSTEGRIVVFGSSPLMISKVLFGLLGNGDIVMNSVAWMAERTDQIAISRPDIKQHPLSIDETTQLRIKFFTMWILPALVGLLGLFVHTVFKKY